MHRILPALAIVGAVLSALGAALVSGEGFWLAFPIYGIITSVFLLMERSRAGLGTGLALLHLSLLGVVTFVAVTGENVDLEFLFHRLGPPFTVGLGLLGTASVLVVFWNEVHPPWVPIAGLGVVAVAYGSLFATPVLGSLFLSSLPAGILCLLAIAPAVRALYEDAQIRRTAAARTT